MNNNTKRYILNTMKGINWLWDEVVNLIAGMVICAALLGLERADDVGWVIAAYVIARVVHIKFGKPVWEYWTAKLEGRDAYIKWF